MHDIVEKLDGALIQHGKLSDRIYLMKVGDASVPSLLPKLDELAGKNGYTKIFAKVPEPAAEPLEAHGFKREAFVPGFYNGQTAACFLGRFLSEERATEQKPDTVDDVLAVAQDKATVPPAAVSLSDGLTHGEVTPDECDQVVDVYREVFATYPFPIHDPDYIRETMDDNVVYFAVREKGRIISLASSEMDVAGQSVEMTDFATPPVHRGSGLALFLLYEMEDAMRARGIKTAFTIARSLSYGMNATFAKAGYEFAGTLLNNTNISGGLESMNIWFKPLGGMSPALSEAEAEAAAAV